MGIAELFLVDTRPDRPLDARAREGLTTVDDKPSKVADFVTQQSFLSFSVMTAAFKIIWKGLQQPFGGWADSAWLPFGMCIAFGVSQFFVSVTNDESGLKRWPHMIPAAFIASTNALVLFAATQGIDPAANAVTGTNAP